MQGRKITNRNVYYSEQHKEVLERVVRKILPRLLFPIDKEELISAGWWSQARYYKPEDVSKHYRNIEVAIWLYIRKEIKCRYNCRPSDWYGFCEQPIEDKHSELKPYLKNLKPRTQCILILYFEYGFTQREIGRRLGMSGQRVSMIMIRALDDLREGLKNVDT